VTIHEIIANMFVFGLSFALIVGSAMFVYTIAHICLGEYELTEKQQSGFSLLTVIIVILLTWR